MTPCVKSSLQRAAALSRPRALFSNRGVLMGIPFIEPGCLGAAFLIGLLSAWTGGLIVRLCNGKEKG
jgi:hypothetical protein